MGLKRQIWPKSARFGRICSSFAVFMSVRCVAMRQRLRQLERERDRVHRDGITWFEGEANINSREVACLQDQIDRLRAQMPQCHVWPHQLGAFARRRR